MIATAYCTWDMDKVSRMLHDCKTYLGTKYGGPKET